MTPGTSLTVRTGQPSSSGRNSRESPGERRAVGENRDAGAIQGAKRGLKELIPNEKELGKENESIGNVALFEMAVERKAGNIPRRIGLRRGIDPTGASFASNLRPKIPMPSPSCPALSHHTATKLPSALTCG